MQVSGPTSLLPTFAQAKPSNDTANLFAPKAEPDSAAKTEFIKRARMTAAEQMRAQILESMGLKEEDLKAMSADDRAKLEAKIKETIKTKVEQEEAKKGVLVDIKA